MGDGFHPFTGPRLKALQMMAYIEDLKFKREDRQRQRQLFELDLQDRKRKSTFDDVTTRLYLEALGGLETPAGIGGDFRAAMGGRAKPIDTPVGRYSLPTQAQRQQRADQEAVRKGQREGLAA